MVGAGEKKRNEFEAKVKDWGMSAKVCLTGVRRDVHRIMSGSDLLLFPSLPEGLGMVVVEAQAAGLRVLASDTTPREAVVNPHLVTLAPLSDSTADWAERVLYLIGLPRLEARECHELVRQSPFSIENSVGHLLKIYNEGQPVVPQY